jgi:saccharopine dehydrogenase (NAD+, L-lysine-forming)
LSGTVLIYGATGYTGKLIAKVAAGLGARPILAGRDLEKVEAIAKPLQLAFRAFDLGDPIRIDAGIKDVSVVLCIAGPFSATSKPMADACLRNHVHYLDITGKITSSRLSPRGAPKRRRKALRCCQASASTSCRATALPHI